MTTIDRNSPVSSYVQDASASLMDDPTTALAAMMIQQSQDSRSIARDRAQAEDRAIKQYAAAEVSEMRKEASDLRDAAKSRAWGKMIGGGLKMASGAFAIGSASSQSEATKLSAEAASAKSVGDFSTYQSKMSEVAARQSTQGYVKAAGVALDGGSDLSNAAGEYTAAEADAKAAEHSARAKEADYAAQAAERRADAAKELVNDSRELASAASDHLKNLSRAQGDADQASVYLRG